MVLHVAHNGFTLFNNCKDPILWAHHHWQYFWGWRWDDIRRLGVGIKKNLPNLTLTHWLSCSIKSYTREWYRLLWPPQIPGKYCPRGASHLQTSRGHSCCSHDPSKHIRRFIWSVCSTGLDQWTNSKDHQGSERRHNMSYVPLISSNTVTCITQL